MTRLPVHDENTAPGDAAEILGKMKQELGAVFNIYGAAANSPAALKAYTQFSQTLDEEGTLSPEERECIALASAQANNCHYCQSAHTAVAKEIGLSDETIRSVRQFDCEDPQFQALADFTRKVVETRAEVGEEDLAKLREAGYDDGQLVEIHGQIIRNVWTNYFNHIFATEIDFPEAEALEAAAGAE